VVRNKPGKKTNDKYYIKVKTESQIQDMLFNGI